MNAILKKAIVISSIFSLIWVFLKQFQASQKGYQTAWKNVSNEMQIIFDSEDPKGVYYENVQFDVPKSLKGRKDWHDYIGMKADAKRTGHGEKGQPTINIKLFSKEQQDLLISEYGVNGVVSDMISINRSLPDTRKLRCRQKLYISKLPTVSIIIVYLNEYPSVFKRSLHSIVNRAPKELIKEIILVYHANSQSFLKDLKKYIDTKFSVLVKFCPLKIFRNLITAKLEGAKAAKSDVLIFLNGHIECNYNWLPPLLEPIAFDNRTITMPIVDFISSHTFAYKANNDEGRRVGFDWDLKKEFLPLYLKFGTDKTKPYKDIIMSSETFAIERNFFWRLGGFDEGFDNYEVEQFELSFKIWLCEGQLLTVPCSHVGMVDMDLSYKADPREMDIKRVAEIWMDEYKKYVFSANPKLYEAINPGDLNLQKTLQKNLKCHSFKWFLEAIAPDLLKINPPEHPPDYAWGSLYLAGFPRLCIDSIGKHGYQLPDIDLCADDLKQPHSNQNWRLSWHRNLQVKHKNLCLEVIHPPPNATVYMLRCDYKGDGQVWYYNSRLQYLIHKKFGIACLDLIETERTWSLVVNECDPNNIGMRWAFSYIN